MLAFQIIFVYIYKKNPLLGFFYLFNIWVEPEVLLLKVMWHQTVVFLNMIKKGVHSAENLKIVCLNLRKIVKIIKFI